MPRYSSPVSFQKAGVFHNFLMAVLLCLFITAKKVEGQYTDLDELTFIAQDGKRDCVKNFNPNTDYFPNKISTPLGGEFSIKYKKYYKVITNERETEDNVYIAYLCGTQVPPGETGILVEIPPVSYGLTSTTFLPYFHQLAALDGFKLYPTVGALPQCAVASNQVLQGGCFFSTACNAQVWADMDKPVDILFTDPFSITTPPPGKANVIISETDSKTIGDMFSWIEFVSAFLNREAIAKDVVAAQNSQQTCLKNQAAQDAVSSNVLVLTLFSGVSFSVGTCDNYYCELVEDAGGHVLDSVDLGVSTAQTVQQLLDAIEAKGEAVDVVVLLYYAVGDFNGFPGPDEGNSTFFTDLLHGIDSLGSQDGKPVRAYHIPNTDPWFDYQPGAPGAAISDFVNMIAEPTSGDAMNFFAQYYPQQVNNLIQIEQATCECFEGAFVSTLQKPCLDQSFAKNVQIFNNFKCNGGTLPPTSDASASGFHIGTWVLIMLFTLYFF